MKNWPLRRRLMFISLVPLLIVTIVLSSYYIKTSINTLRDQIKEQGELLSRQLAPAVEYGVISGNKASLEKIIQHALETESVISVSILDVDKNLLYSAAQPKTDRSLDILLFDYIFELVSGITTTNQFSAPITTERIILDDFFSGEVSGDTEEDVVGHVVVEVSLSYSAYKQLISIFSAFAISMGVLIVVFYVSIKISRNITDSIQEMARTVSRIQEGNLKARSRVSTGAELAELSHGINAMAENISRSEENLTKEVVAATSELLEKNDALAEAERSAVAANNAKSVFLANMSHEIRTPMNGVLGFTEVLLKTPLDVQQKHYAETIRNASENLLLLINDILDFSRIESGKMPLEKMVVEFNSVLSDIFTFHTGAAYGKGIELLFFIDPEIPGKAEFDPKLFKQVMTNLISNAIKFTDRGYVKVHLGYSRAAQKLTVQVKDTGIGLEENRIEGIFNEFEQGDNSTARKYGGSGLGLAITRRIVELFNGEIKAYNYESGACFEFFMPLVEKAPPQQHGSGPEIALISRDSEVQESYKSIFSRFGYKAECFGDTDSIQSQSYQAIISLLSPQDLHYRQYGEKNMIAMVSTNDPEDLKTVTTWGFGLAAHKTINPKEINDILHERYYLPNLPSAPKVEEVQEADDSSFTGLHVLVVDDNHVNLTLMDTYLNDLNADVLMCDNGERALQVVQTNHIDIVFLDIHMPGMDGFETARSIRKMGFSNTMFPIIGLSADGIGNVRERALASGMDDYILKPVSQRKLIDTINLFVGDKLEASDASSIYQDGEEQLRQELTEMLIAELPNMMEELRSAAAKNDLKKQFHIAHKIHGACVYCDMPGVEKASIELESACRDENAEAVPELLKKLEAVVDQFLQRYH